MADEKQYTYRSPAKITGWSKGLLWALVASGGVYAVLLGLQYRVLVIIETHAFADRDSVIAAAAASDQRVHLFSWWIIALTLVSGVVYFIWVYRTSANVHAMGATDLFTTPGFAVGAYFIPFFNLYAPPTTMAQVWKASVDAPRWPAQKGTFLVGLWWALQIVSGIFGGILYVAGNGSEDIASLKVLTLCLIASIAVNMLTQLTLISLVGGISKRQLEQRASIDGAQAAAVT